MRSMTENFNKNECIENMKKILNNIENEDEDAGKQECERKAFYRLAKRLKQDFKRLPVCIVADSLYACEPVMTLKSGL